MENEEDKLKEILSSIKMEANDDLKARIMHQIHTENALKRKPVSSTSFVKEYFIILGIAYGIILVLGIYQTVNTHTSIFESKEFIYYAVLIMATAGIYGMMNNLMRFKKK